MARDRTISIWYFIGWLVLVYGLLILGAGIGDLSTPSPVVMADLHIGIWWGAFMIAVGAAYLYFFRPGKSR